MRTLYIEYFKRGLDFSLSLVAMVVLSPLLLVLSALGWWRMKGDPFFSQERPGWHEKIFKLYKFRTMTNERGLDGKLLPDSDRLNAYGRFLRSSSLDELPELWCIIKGDMSIVGPRPQLVRDMVFMTQEQRKRHNVRPGLTGLAQIRGRNAITWEEKLSADNEYINNISFFGDVQIVLKTIGSVLRRDGISMEGMDTALDYGDALLKSGKITMEEYKEKQEEADRLLQEYLISPLNTKNPKVQ